MFSYGDYVTSKLTGIRYRVKDVRVNDYAIEEVRVVPVVDNSNPYYNKNAWWPSTDFDYTKVITITKENTMKVTVSKQPKAGCDKKPQLKFPGIYRHIPTGTLVLATSEEKSVQLYPEINGKWNIVEPKNYELYDGKVTISNG